MALETPVTFISDLVATNPASADPKSQGDDHLRNLKTALRNSFAGFTGAVCVAGTDGGAANAYTLTTATPLVAYGSKMAAVFSPAASNTGAATLEISGLGAKAIKRIDGSDLAAGDLAAGSIYVAIYSGAEFRLLAPTKQYIDQLAFSAALPLQSGSAGKFLTTDGGAASWSDTFAIAVNESKGANIASSATINLTTATGNLVHITGTTTITAITIPSGAERTLVFDASLVLTHNAATLILPSGANITTAAGDVAKVRGDGAGNARVVSYQRANGLGVAGTPYAKFSDQKASGTAGGAAVAGDITQTRTLNTAEANSIAGASLSSNTVTLPAGTYQFRARAMAYQVNAHKVFLYNASDATYTGVGSTERAGSSADIFTTSVVSGQFSISAQKNFTLRHYTQTAAATGMGVAASTGQVEVYSELEFWKVA